MSDRNEIQFSKFQTLPLDNSLFFASLRGCESHSNRAAFEISFGDSILLAATLNEKADNLCQQAASILLEAKLCLLSESFHTLALFLGSFLAAYCSAVVALFRSA